MSKILRRDVDRAHDEWARSCSLWPDGNLARVTPTLHFYELRDAYEAQTGKPYTRGTRR